MSYTHIIGFILYNNNNMTCFCNINNTCKIFRKMKLAIYSWEEEEEGKKKKNTT